MRTSIKLFIPAAVLALAGCSPLIYGKAEVPSLQVTQRLSQVKGAPTTVTINGTVVQIPEAQNLALFRDYSKPLPTTLPVIPTTPEQLFDAVWPPKPEELNTGDTMTGDDKANKDRLVNDGSRFAIQGVTLTINPTLSAAGASFARLKKISIIVTPPAAIGGPAVTVGQYDAAVDGTPQATTITLKPPPGTTAPNLLTWFGLSGDPAKIQAVVSGFPPTADWVADVTIDFDAVVQYNVL